jgi:two-component system CheB/CheR fusion protein
METTNEELQSTVEELETTNEELQSTNEELETMNEELQSTNEELDTVNVEMRARTGELDRVNTFLESILTSLHRGVVVLNRDLAVLAWNRGAEELWGLRGEEVSGRHFLNLDIGLPVHELQPAIRRSLAGDAEETVRLAARNRRGRDIACDVDCMPFRTNGEILGVILLMTEVDGES